MRCCFRSCPILADVDADVNYLLRLPCRNSRVFDADPGWWDNFEVQRPVSLSETNSEWSSRLAWDFGPPRPPLPEPYIPFSRIRLSDRIHRVAVVVQR
jgi:hypothetical protein